MRYHFKIHKQKSGYWAECVELTGCVTQAESKDELQVNMQEALNLYLDEPENSKTLYPLPQKECRQRNVVLVPVLPPIAFAFLLRRTRLLNKLTQKETAAKLNLKNIYSYQRLEDGKLTNPGLLTLAKIKKIFPKMTFDEIFI